jgi:hypothetical protein
MLLLSLLVFSTASSFPGFSNQSAVTCMDEEKKETKEEKKHFSEYLKSCNNRIPEAPFLVGKLNSSHSELTPSPFTDTPIQPPDHCC